jgi:tellurite resistance protein TerC
MRFATSSRRAVSLYFNSYTFFTLLKGSLQLIMDWTIPLIILQLVLLEGLLSIDNAAVLGAMVSTLPDTIAVPWPKALKKFGRSLHPILGNQRTAALRVGLLGAYLGRGFMLLVASLIIQNPWLKILGSLYLMYLAFENLGKKEDDEGGDVNASKYSSFWSLVVMINIADMIFSLDNVMAAVSVSDKLWVVMVGVAIGILLMRFAAGVFSYLVEREPVLKTAAYILILNIGIELLVSEMSGFKVDDILRFGISIATILLALAYAHWKPMQVLKPFLVWITEGFAVFADMMKWAISPILAIFTWIGKGLALLSAPILRRS